MQIFEMSWWNSNSLQVVKAYVFAQNEEAARKQAESADAVYEIIEVKHLGESSLIQHSGVLIYNVTPKL